VWTLFAASDGSLWASVNEQVSRLSPDGTWEHFTRGDPFDPGNFGEATDFAEDAEGGVWVSSRGAGVYRYFDGAWSQPDGLALPTPYVNSITIAPDGALWFGTEGGGAARFDGGATEVFRTGDGLINDFVFDIYVEPSGVVWFATNGGVTRSGP
jgi:sugar lactone lactonase YvrE